MSTHNSVPILRFSEMLGISSRSVIWASGGIGEPTSFNAKAGRIIINIIEGEPDSTTLVVDCLGLFQLQPHAFAFVEEAIIRHQTRLVLINAAQCGRSFQLALERLNVRTESVRATGDTFIFTPIGVTFAEFDIHDLHNSWARIGRKTYEEVVRRSFRPFESGRTRLQSTPLMASGIFNARGIISNPVDFVAITVGLTEMVERMIKEGPPTTNYRILSVSLRASPFAFAVGQFLSHDVEIVDHMGPNMKILEEYTLNSLKGKGPYCYIGDFTIGCSEIRVAETYAIAKGARIQTAAVIGSALDSEEYPFSGKFESLVNLGRIRDSETYPLIDRE